MGQPRAWSFSPFSSFPQGIGILFFVQIFSTLSYSVLYSTLVLYMTNQLGFSKVEANTITGFFLAFNYGLHLLGGFFGGRLISNRLLFSLGMMLLVIACVLLSIPSKAMLYLGLATFLTGSGLNVTCLNCMVTQRFETDDPRRENAFFWIYSGMNVGFFAGFTISGLFEQSGSYHTLFMLSGVGNLLALFLVLTNWHILKDKGTILEQLNSKQKRQRQLFGSVMVFAMVPCLLLLLNYASVANRLVLVTGALMVAILAILAVKQQHQYQTKKMFAFIILMLGSLVFWSLYQMAPMGLTLFIKHNVNRHIGGYLISPQWVQNVNTIVIVFGGPLMSMFYSRLRSKGININIPVQFSFALLLIGLAFVIIPVGIAHADSQGYTAIEWVIASYVLQSIGELLLSPVGYAMIGRLAPTHLQGLMMGVWMMTTGVAATLSNYFSNMMITNDHVESIAVTNQTYSHGFSELGWLALAAAIILFLLFPFVNRLIEAKADDTAEANEGESLFAGAKVEEAIS